MGKRGMEEGRGREKEGETGRNKEKGNGGRKGEGVFAPAIHNSFRLNY